MADEYRVTLGSMVVENSLFDIILGYNLLKRFEFVWINYRTHQVIIKTTNREVQCKLPTNTYTQTCAPRRSGSTGALEKANAQGTPVQLKSNSSSTRFGSSSCQGQYFGGSSCERQYLGGRIFSGSIFCGSSYQRPR